MKSGGTMKGSTHDIDIVGTLQDIVGRWKELAKGNRERAEAHDVGGNKVEPQRLRSIGEAQVSCAMDIEDWMRENPDALPWRTGVPPLGTDIVLMSRPRMENPVIAKRREGRWWIPENGDWLSNWESDWRWKPLPLPPTK